eukprot:scaffold89101_cov65-Attheya_sp.AAC.3
MITRRNKKQRTASKGPTLGPTTEEHIARCSGCTRTFTSARGLKQHISQSERCSSAILNAIEMIQGKAIEMIQGKAVDLSHQKDTNPTTAEEIDDRNGNARLFGDEDNESEVEDDEIEIQFNIEAQDELLNAHEPQDDAGLTDTGVTPVEFSDDIQLPHARYFKALLVYFKSLVAIPMENKNLSDSCSS